MDRVVLRIQANPQEPHSATADFDLVRMVMANEVSRERWTLSLQFQFLDEIPPDLIVHNPMGIVISLSARRPGDRYREAMMIEHLQGRERKLEPLGWTGCEAEWIALVCLHSGVFTRAQFCHYFDAQRKAARFVQTLVDWRAAVESEWTFQWGRKVVPDIEQADLPGAGGREHPPPSQSLPAGGDAAAPIARFRIGASGHELAPRRAGEGRVFEKLGLSRRLIPRRIYYGAVGAQKRYFALKLPLAGGR